MLEECGKIDGPFRVSEDTFVRGMITVEATVSPGVTLTLHGMVTGDLLVEEGATAFIHGMVNGTIRNAGHIELWGVVDAVADLTDNAITIIHPNSRVRGLL